MWGSNAMGQCGMGDDQREVWEPTELGLGKIRTMTCGYYHSIAAPAGGGLYACGSNAQGQAGKNTSASAKSYVTKWEEIQVGQYEFDLLAAGESHSLAFTSDNMLFAWGSGARGQIGLALARGGPCNFPKPMIQPAAVVRGAELLSISAGGNSTFFLVKDVQLSVDYGMELNGHLYKEPSQPIPVAVATWNVNNGSPTHDSLRWFRRVSRTGALVIFGLQEVDLRGRTLALDAAHKMDRNVKSAFKGLKGALKDGSFVAAAQRVVSGWQEGSNHRSGAAVMIQSKHGEEWRKAVKENLGSEYSELFARQMVGIELLVFVHRSLQPHVTPLFCNSIGCGLMGAGGNKGAVAASLQVHGSRLCLVTAHLTAHDKNVDDRNQDFHEILQGVLTEGCTGGHVLSHDSVLWCGDLNYRVELPRDTAVTHAKSNDFATLMKHDQLKQQIAKGKAFTGFEEGPIAFGPTFKFDVGTNEFDSSPKQRCPSYTDRILARNHRSELNGGRGLEIQQYDRADSNESDHKPVFCTMQYRPAIISKERYDILYANMQNFVAVALSTETRPPIEAPPDLRRQPSSSSSFVRASSSSNQPSVTRTPSSSAPLSQQQAQPAPLLDLLFDTPNPAPTPATVTPQQGAAFDPIADLLGPAPTILIPGGDGKSEAVGMPAHASTAPSVTPGYSDPFADLLGDIASGGDVPTVGLGGLSIQSNQPQQSTAAAPRLLQPSAPSGQKPNPPPLPSGWDAAWSDQDKKYYFYHADGRVTWDVPTR